MSADRIKVWQCVGCGRIDDPRPCVGICRDEKVEYVLASGHERQLAALLQLARRIAFTTPRDGEWESSYRALQERARKLL
jgi:hypothetical protein